MDIVVLPQCKKEIDEFPMKVKEELLDAISDLVAGVLLTTPISKKMEGMGQVYLNFVSKNAQGFFE